MARGLIWKTCFPDCCYGNENVRPHVSLILRVRLNLEEEEREREGERRRVASRGAERRGEPSQLTVMREGDSKDLRKAEPREKERENEREGGRNGKLEEGEVKSNGKASLGEETASIRTSIWMIQKRKTRGRRE